MKKILLSTILLVVAVVSFNINAMAQEVEVSKNKVENIVLSVENEEVIEKSGNVEEKVKEESTNLSATEKVVYNGWENSSGNYYYYEYGQKVKGWRFIDGNYYYFNIYNGTMYHDTEKQINGQYYRFKNSGAMLTGWYSDNVGNYQIYGSNGAKLFNQWYHDGYDWYYLDSFGNMQVGYEYHGGNLYHFGSKGNMTEGWASYIHDGEVQYTYHHASGIAYENEWLYENGKWYYFDFTNDMCKDKSIYINGNWYYFNNSGAQHLGWLYKDNVYEYHGYNGAYQSEWLYEDGKWYYLDENRRMVTGDRYIDGRVYHFGTDGVMYNY